MDLFGPSGVVMGNNDFVIVVDDWGVTFPGGSVAESDENNNTKATSTTIK